MNNSIQLVVFDIAGTTVKDKGEIARAFQSAMLEYGYDVPKNRIYPSMGYKKSEAIRMMLEVYEKNADRITPAYINIIHDKFIELMIDYYSATDELEAFPHSENMFRYLKERGVKIGLDTGFSNDITDVIIERLGWLKDGKVDYVVSSNQVPAGRPHPYMIQSMMQRAGIDDPLHVIKVGDTEADIHEGKNAGCRYSIAVTTGAFSRRQLIPYEPSFIIDDLKELINIFEKED